MAYKITRKTETMRKTLELIVTGDREVIDGAKAREIVTSFTQTKLTEEKKSQQKLVVSKIVLSGKSYTVDAANIIAEYIRDIGLNIKVAILSDIIASRPEDEALAVLKIICDSFLHSSLEEVDLSENALGSKGISACDSVLSGQANSLKKLSLCNNGLSATAMEEVADILCEGSSDDTSDENSIICSRLTSIHFFNNMSGNAGCTAFARILSKCTSNLTDVRFSGTRAKYEGSMVIATALECLGDKLMNIKNLDLADNSFKEKGGIVLARALEKCPKLQKLKLGDCLLGDDATGSICRAIWSVDAPLEYFDISGNELTKKGAKCIAGIMKDGIGGTLKIIHCEENELTSRGVAYIAASLPAGIEEVKLGFNECGSIGAQALIQRFTSDASGNMPKSIHLDGNMFPPNDVKMLKETFGELLPEMEDNDDEEDVDADLEEEEEEIDDDDLVAQLVEKVKGLDMKHSIC